MKLDIISDLHLDFYRGKMPVLVPKSDILLVAGDLAECRHQNWLDGLRMLTSKWRDVVYVAGNHEYYGSTVEAFETARGKAAEFKNLHWLERETVTIDGQRFCGATGWFRDRPDNVFFQSRIGDFRYIRGFVPWVYDQHQETLNWMRQTITPADVVITHHLPSDACVVSRWRGDALNRFFVGDFPVAQLGAKAWVFGHTHDPMDFEHEGTRLICNPAGYPGERDIAPAVVTIEIP